MRKIGAGVLIVCIVLFMAWVRVAVGGFRARVMADRLLAQGQTAEAIGYYDRALHMYFPGSIDVAQAVASLQRIADHFAAQNDFEAELHVRRVLRSGLYAARGLYQPYAAEIAASEERIAALVAMQAQDESVAAKHLALLRENHDPQRGWSMLALLGFALWIAAALAFLWRALTPDGKLLTRPAMVWGLVFVAGYALWLAGLSLA
ncbi:MAG TPA: hypothetical protein PKW95_10550 [bacterium]|nr:hypothetical protein [bacterium]